jgi:hypothetical protein
VSVDADIDLFSVFTAEGSVEIGAKPVSFRSKSMLRWTSSEFLMSKLKGFQHREQWGVSFSSSVLES